MSWLTPGPPDPFIYESSDTFGEELGQFCSDELPSPGLRNRAKGFLDVETKGGDFDEDAGDRNIRGKLLVLLSFIVTLSLVGLFAWIYTHVLSPPRLSIHCNALRKGMLHPSQHCPPGTPLCFELRRATPQSSFEITLRRFPTAGQHDTEAEVIWSHRNTTSTTICTNSTQGTTIVPFTGVCETHRVFQVQVSEVPGGQSALLVFQS
eukprot:c13836_g1_i1.p1 GENE.c13836_g1_i1~~c13836_g1_i1.p1  ORF type:complete len:207 (+),score=37.81 c13836_g1_i1:36-656(+)